MAVTDDAEKILAAGLVARQRALEDAAEVMAEAMTATVAWAQQEAQRQAPEGFVWTERDLEFVKAGVMLTMQRMYLKGGRLGPVIVAVMAEMA